MVTQVRRRVVLLQWRNTDAQYGVIAQLLHWSVTLIVIVQAGLALRAVDLPVSLERLQLLARHKSLGMTVLVLVALRLVWRLANPQPRPLGTRTTILLARASHWTFYGLLVAMPLSGWIFSSASNLSVSWFGLFTWPDLVSRDEALAELARATHRVLAVSLLALGSLHVLAALTHQFVWRDDALVRMLPRRRLRGAGRS